MEFKAKYFHELTSVELYEILYARAMVFTKDEEILYPDADGKDYDCIHVFSTDADGRVNAYLRMFYEEGNQKHVHIGRVLTINHGCGHGKMLMDFAENAAVKMMNASTLVLNSQDHAEGFYLKCGFETISEPYIEAGVPHVKMKKTLNIEHEEDLSKCAMKRDSFCTCSDVNCPFNPINHDKGCSPCIAKNLREGEIPSCFFNAVSGNDNQGSYFYEDFANEVLKNK